MLHVEKSSCRSWGKTRINLPGSPDGTGQWIAAFISWVWRWWRGPNDLPTTEMVKLQMAQSVVCWKTLAISWTRVPYGNFVFFMFFPLNWLQNCVFEDVQTQSHFCGLYINRLSISEDIWSNHTFWTIQAGWKLPSVHCASWNMPGSTWKGSGRHSDWDLETLWYCSC